MAPPTSGPRHCRPGAGKRASRSPRPAGMPPPRSRLCVCWSHSCPNKCASSSTGAVASLPRGWRADSRAVSPRASVSPAPRPRAPAAPPPSSSSCCCSSFLEEGASYSASPQGLERSVSGLASGQHLLSVRRGLGRAGSFISIAGFSPKTTR